MQLDQVRPVYDAPGPYTTVRCDVTRGNESAAQEIEARWTELARALESEGAPDEDVAAARERVLENTHETGALERTVVVAHGEVLLDDVRPAKEEGLAHATHAALPDLAGWAADSSEAVPFVLVVVDREGAEASAYHAWHRGPASSREVEGDTFHLHKVPSGGWSHRRYQQATQETWEKNARQVVDEVRSLVRTHRPRAVLVAGDVTMRSEVAGQLGEGTASDAPLSVHQLESGGRAPGASTEAMWTEVHALLGTLRAAQEQELTATLERVQGQGGGGAVGLSETLAALAQSKVDTLLLGSGLLPGTEVVPAQHEGLALPEGVDRDRPVPADQALLAAACLTDAQVQGLAPELVQVPGFDGCAALLRWA